MAVNMAEVTIGAGAARARSRRGPTDRQARASSQWEQRDAAPRGVNEGAQ
jgi:hypothetical protein